MSGQTETAGGGEQAGGAAKQVVRRVIDALSEKQQRALALVTEGRPIKQVGEEVGVDRGTIYRWMRTDPHFRAAYNAWQLEQRESYRASLLKCAETAVAKVIRMVDIDGDLAWKLVKEMGLLSKPQTLNTDPTQLEREIAVEQLEVSAHLAERRSNLMDGEAEATFRSIAQRVLGDRVVPTLAPEAETKAQDGKL